MAGTNDVRSKSTDPAVQEMIAKAAKIGIKTVWDRYEAMQPQCGFRRYRFVLPPLPAGSLPDRSFW